MTRRLAALVTTAACAGALLVVGAAPAHAGCEDYPCDPPPMQVCYPVVKWRVCL